MTRRPSTPLDRPDPLTLAIEAYGARFPWHGLPFLRPAVSLEGREAAIRLLCAERWRRARPLDGSGRGGRARPSLAASGRLPVNGGIVRRRSQGASTPWRAIKRGSAGSARAMAPVCKGCVPPGRALTRNGPRS